MTLNGVTTAYAQRPCDVFRDSDTLNIIVVNNLRSSWAFCWLCYVSSSDCREPVSHVHVFNSAAQSQSAQQSAARFRRRTLPAVPRSFRQQDLEEHLAVRSCRPPRLWTWTWYALWLRGDGVRQQLWVPSLQHGHNEDWTISILTTSTTEHLHYWLFGLPTMWKTDYPIYWPPDPGLLTTWPLVSRWCVLSIFALITNWVCLVHLLHVRSSDQTRRNELRIYCSLCWDLCTVCRHSTVVPWSHISRWPNVLICICVWW